MTKEELIKLGLDDATASKVAQASAEELKNFIAKTKFDELAESKKSLETQVTDRDKQLETLKKSTGDIEAMKKQIETLQEENKTSKTAYEGKIKQMRIDNAVNSALTTNKAKNATAVKALLDLKDAEIDDAGNVKGLDKQIKKLVESEDTAFLFDKADPNNQTPPPVKGGAPALGSNNKPNDAVSIGAQMAQKYNAQFVTPKGDK